VVEAALLALTIAVLTAARTQESEGVQKVGIKSLRKRKLPRFSPRFWRDGFVNR
jgi:hypothetical protein